MVTNTTYSGPRSGTNSNDTMYGVAQNGTSQIHLYAGGGDDTLVLDFADISDASAPQLTGYSHGHHVRGDGGIGSESGNDNATDRGRDTFRFTNLENVDNIVVGRIEDFDISRDYLYIGDYQITPANLAVGYGAAGGFDWKIVEFDTDQRNSSNQRDSATGTQQWLSIDTGEGRVFYALEGARVTNGDGVANGGQQEAHFIGAGSDNRINKATIDALDSVSYVDPQNYIPRNQSSTGISYNDDDNQFADVQDVIEHGAVMNSHDYYDHDDDDSTPEVLKTSNDITLNLSGNDLIAAGLNDDSVNAGAGNDKVWGGSGEDTIQGGDGNDTLYGGTSNDILGGGNGHDKLYGEHGDDLIYGDGGNDTIQGSFGDDTIIGADGDDRIGGGEGADSLRGDNGNDRIWGDEGKDTIQGGTGRDTLSGGADNDSIGGGNDNDQLRGGDGRDTIYGDSGNDKIYGDGGNDILSGGAGNDRFVFRNGDGSDTISDFNNGNNRIDLRATGVNDFNSLTITSSSNGSSNVDYGSGDIELRFVSTSALTSDDFIF